VDIFPLENISYSFVALESPSSYYRSIVEITFFDQIDPIFPDHDKTDGFHNEVVAGRFWTNFTQRYPNYPGQRVRVFKGTTEAANLSELRLIFEGEISDFDYVEDGKVRLTLTDILSARGDERIPNAIQTTNVTEDALALDGGETTLEITDNDAIRILEMPTIMSFEGTNESIFADDQTEFEHKLVHAYSGLLPSFSLIIGWAYNRNTDLFYFVYTDTSVLRRLVSINRQTLEVIQINTNLTENYFDICYDNLADVLFATDRTELFTIDTTDGTETSVGSHVTHSNIKGICVNDLTGIGTATLFGIEEDTGDINRIVSINRATGVSSLTFNLGFSTVIQTAACDVSPFESITSPGVFTFRIYTITGGVIKEIIFLDQTEKDVVILPSQTGDAICMFKFRNDMVIQLQDKNNGDEFIRIDRVNNPGVLNITRGQYGTATPLHPAGLKFKQVAVWTDVNDTGISSDKGIHVTDAMLSVIHIWLRIPYSRIDWESFFEQKFSWLVKYNVRRILANTTRADELLRKLRETGIILLWQNESQKTEIITNHQVNPDIIVPFIDESSNMIEDLIPLVDQNLRGQISEATVHYSPEDIWGFKPHTADDDFLLVNIVSDVDVSNLNNFGKAFPETFHNDFIFTEFVARSAGDAQVLWFATPKKIIDFLVSKKDISIKTGDVVEIETETIVDNDGNLDRRVFFVLKKREFDDGSILLRCLETPMIPSNDTVSDRFAFVHETEFPADFDVATDQELKWGYINDENETFQYLIG